MAEAALEYCPDLPAVLSRLRRLFVDRAQDAVLAAMKVPSQAVAQFAEAYPAGRYYEYPDPHERAAFWDAYLRERATVADDSVPSASLKEMDQGLYGGLVGGKVQFMSSPERGMFSSMVERVLGDLSEIETLRIDPAHEWFARYVRQMEVFREAAQGKFGISHFILINGLNFIYELVGATQTYMELLERPKLVQKATDFAFELNLWVQNTFFEHVPLLTGGTCSDVVQWLPDRIVSESVDPFHMTSVGYFERWGRRQLEDIFAQFDGGIVHIHGNGRHLLEAVATVNGLRAIFLGDDTGFPLAFDVLDELHGRTGDMPLALGVGFPDFCRALEEHRLLGGVLYRVADVPDADTANRWMERVREYQV